MEKMQTKPTHEDIEKYDYILQYSLLKNTWYAAYDTDSKGTVWYKWDGTKFKSIFNHELPGDLHSFVN